MSKKNNKEDNGQRASTLAALLKDKPKRGRPPRAVSRQNVYVALRSDQKATMKRLVDFVPADLSRADLADLAISILTARMEALRRAVAGRNREIPEGITDMDSLYLLWDLPLPPQETAERWTSVRVSPQQVIELGRAHGTLNAAFGASRSQTFSLGLTLLAQYLEENPLHETDLNLEQVRARILNN